MDEDWIKRAIINKVFLMIRTPRNLSSPTDSRSTPQPRSLRTQDLSALQLCFYFSPCSEPRTTSYHLLGTSADPFVTGALKWISLYPLHRLAIKGLKFGTWPNPILPKLPYKRKFFLPLVNIFYICHPWTYSRRPPVEL